MSTTTADGCPVGVLYLWIGSRASFSVLKIVALACCCYVWGLISMCHVVLCVCASYCLHSPGLCECRPVGEVDSRRPLLRQDDAIVQQLRYRSSCGVDGVQGIIVMSIVMSIRFWQFPPHHTNICREAATPAFGTPLRPRDVGVAVCTIESDNEDGRQNTM